MKQWWMKYTNLILELKYRHPRIQKEMIMMREWTNLKRDDAAHFLKQQNILVIMLHCWTHLQRETTPHQSNGCFNKYIMPAFKVILPFISNFCTLLNLNYI
ncbi:hypothetical protein AOLI_G00061870 [Acnodon oligacanthus]